LLVDHIDYDSFGQVLAETNAIFGDRYKFTGREFDDQIGLYYLRARFYDPSIGRFVNEDPLRFEGGCVNLYSYVNNNPLNGKDPTGRTALLENLYVKNAIAGAILAPSSYIACSLILGRPQDITITKLAFKAIGGAVLSVGFQAGKAFVWGAEVVSFGLKGKLAWSAAITTGKVLAKDCDTLDLLWGIF
jgi:RHS repeat-associated protein